jgi:hypothetical protein
MSRKRTRRLADAAASIKARRDTDHEGRNRIAHAVYVAIRDCPEGALLVPELYGPVVVAAEMAWRSVAVKAGLPLTEATAEEIVGYLVDGFTLMAYEFDVQHFEAHKAMREQAQRLRELALKRKPEIDAELARRQASEA